MGSSWGLSEASWGPLGAVLEASWEPLGGLSGASWGPAGPQSELGRHFDPHLGRCWSPTWSQNGSIMEAKSQKTWSISRRRSWNTNLSHVGPVFGPCWHHFRSIFRSYPTLPSKHPKIAKIAFPPRRESHFQNSGPLNKHQQVLRKRLPKRSSRQERLGAPLGLDFDPMLAPFWSRNSLENG